MTAAMFGLAFQGQATPYATSLTNDAGTISFRLNESADNVKVVAGGVTNDLGALAAGLHTFPLGVAGSYQVEVFKASPPGYASAVGPNRGAVLQISTDSNPVRFNNPRGLAVNTDPASPYFGRVYVANAAAGTAGGRPVGDGIYMLNADFTDAVGQGDTARTGGLDFTTGATVSPYRLDVGQDNNLYISDWSDSTGSLYVTDPNVSDGSGQNVLGGPTGSPFPVTATRIHGSIAGIVVEGSLGAGNLTAYVIDEDLQTDRASSTATQRQSLWRHDIGATLPGPFVMPTQLALHPNTFLRTVGGQIMDLARGTNGNFYVSNYRSSGAEPAVWVLDTNNVVVWNSLVETRTMLGTATNADVLRAAGGLDVSPRGDFLAVINIETNGMFVVPLNNNGIPDLTNRLLVAGFNTVTGQGRDIAFDLAGNLYAVATNTAMMRVFSPGGTTTAITGSDGTFELISPPKVRAVAEDNQGSEQGPDTISFNIWREEASATALTVSYTLTGTATNGVDYASDVLTAVIPAGETNVVVVITPVNDAIAEGAETVILTIVPTAAYNTGNPLVATGTIVDDEPLVSVVALDREGNEDGDPLVFEIWRAGLAGTSEPLTVNYTLTGTATNGLDYPTNVLSITIPAGETNVLLVITPTDDAEAEFTETVIITLVGAPAYLPTAPTSASGSIGDNEIPTLSIVARANAYEPFAVNGVTFVITRRGATNGDVFVALQFSGTATKDADYTEPQIYMEVGAVTTNVVISPIDDVELEGDETVIVSFIENGYAIGTPATATRSIIDDECPPAPVLFGDNFNSDTSADWVLKFGSNTNIVDYTLNWAFDYGAAGIPAPPGASDSVGVKLTVNKTNAAANGSAAVNLYPRNQTFSGDYALRFDMYLSYGTVASTEHALAGINHSGLLTNRVSQSATAGNSTRGTDGIWVAIENDGSNNRDWSAYSSTNANNAAVQITNRTAANLANVITAPPYTTAGSPGNLVTSGTKSWADVELSQVGGTVTLKVNKRVIYTINNTYGFNAGTIMIGYNDQFDSVGNADTYVIFDNLEVVRLGISITDVVVSGNTVQLDFSSSHGGSAGDYRVESSDSLSSTTWTTESTATVAPNGGGFRATVTSSGDNRFYRIAKAN